MNHFAQRIMSSPVVAKSTKTLRDLAKNKKVPVKVGGVPFTLKLVKAKMGINISLETHGKSTRISGAANPDKLVEDWLQEVKNVYKQQIVIDPLYL